MNAMAWLRKLGYGSPEFRFRNEFINFQTLEGLKPLDPAEATEPRRRLLNGISVPTEREERCPGALSGPWEDSDRVAAAKVPQLKPLVLVDTTPERARSAPFVARDAEFRVLLRAWRTAADGHGRVALVRGEAGMGKSRIIRELCRRQMAHSHTRLWHRCAPEYAASPLYPLVSRLQQSAGIIREDGPAERLAKLATSVTSSLDGIEDPREAAALLAQLPGVDVPEPHSRLKLMPQQLRQRIFDVLLALVQGLARRQLVVAVYEDLQWADPSTLEYLDRLIHRIAGLPVLAVLTFRPEFETPWNGRASAVPIALPPLEDAPCRTMVKHLCGPETLAEPVLDEIIRRSRGVPLLLEELTSTALEAAEAIDACVPAEVRAPEVAPGLAEAVAVRLGRSSTVAAVALAAAVIGCEFTREMLAALADWPEDRLDRALERLVRSGLVVHDEANASYAFKHSLIQAAAYGSLPDSVRRSLHLAVARLLEERAPDEAVRTPELMVHHYAAAGASERAVAWCLVAGKRAANCCAHAEAIALFSKALELLDILPAYPERTAYRAAVLAALAQSLTVTKGAEAPEVDQACGQARVLCQGADPHPALLPAIGTLWDHYSTRADFEAAGELAGHCHRLAASAEDPCWSTEADLCRGVGALFMGQLPDAHHRLTRSVARLDANWRWHLAPDRRIVARAHLAQALWLCGYPDQAAQVSQEAITAARAAGHPFVLTYALLAASWVCQLRRDAEASRALASDAIAMAAEAGLPVFLAIGSILRDAAATDLQTAEPTVAAAAIDQALDTSRAEGAKIARPYLLSLSAAVHETAGENEQALDVLADAAELARTTGERWYEPEILRRQGDLLLRQSVTNRRVASAYFCQAIALANQQGSKSFELRAALSLAGIWSDLGRRAQALDLLTPVYAWFKEGFCTADLLAAKALLNELSGGHDSAPARTTDKPPAPRARRRRPCRSGGGRARTGDRKADSGTELRIC
jgi:predicted ATPase